ncbi:hypothetical protein [Oceanobacillus salinisoli]|uniref:hypothetical protein n=1 Tax=Oceanobacillus salinisoli TaxID=2678611 RepID=UPI0012E0D011|nr:hypothetical protein [Oceanobacillus salinisoli]
MYNINERLNDNNDSVVIDFTSNSKALLIAFGGIQGGLGIPVFEFFNIASQFPVKKMFIRDFNQSWYQRGLENTTLKDVNDLYTFLKLKVQETKPEKVIIVGNSAGGFSALLFGNLLEADIVHAFAPQTFIDKKNRMLNLDFRWRKQVKKIYHCNGIKSDYLDLKKVFGKNKLNTKTKYNIYYDVTHRLDRTHSERMRNFKGVTLFKYEDGGHNVVKKMKENGDLLKLLKSSFD